ncbi:hypothetical protein ABZ626_03855 [Streptomyces longispororuber]|uniref:hypothetical protein n=1 Tax=Streptomyces longispororuber TaxID=68230 RepID=UPI0033D67221
MNDYRTMRNINANLFVDTPTNNALHEYDTHAHRLVQEAAQHLIKARSDGNRHHFEQADTLTRELAVQLGQNGGRSLYVRFLLMVATRLVELEAALALTVRAQDHVDTQ